MKKWAELCEKRNVVVQAGGNCGLFPHLLSKEFKRVDTFEPDALHLYCLCSNNPLDNVVKIQAAVGFNREQVHMVETWKNNAGAHVVKPEA